VGFLDEIVRATRETVASPTYLSGLGPRRTRERSIRMSDAIRRTGASGAVLVEFKRVSPGSASPALPARTPAEFVRLAEPGGVVGYSCIATVPRFDGAPADVAALASATSRPVLFKDFVVDRVQLDAAVRAGADAVLLIARLASEGFLEVPLPELASEAHARGLEVLLEFHQKAELRQAVDVGADMFGVNARDLDTLRMEPDVAESTLRAATGLRPLLGLSGVSSSSDARRFWNAGADGILVGSAAARSGDPAAFLRSLHRGSGGGTA